MNIIETLPQLLRQLRDYERGVTTVEHAIMLVLIAIAVAAFGSGLTRTVASVFSRMVGGLAGAP